MLDDPGAGHFSGNQSPNVRVEVVRLNDIDPMLSNITCEAQNNRQGMQALYPMASIRIFEKPHPGGAESRFDFTAERVCDVRLDLSSVEGARQIQQVGFGAAQTQRLDDVKDFYFGGHDKMAGTIFHSRPAGKPRDTRWIKTT